MPAPSHRPARAWRRLRALGVALVGGVLGLGVAMPASAAIVAPTGGVSLTVGVNISFVALEGPAASLDGINWRAELWRGGFLVAVSESDAAAPGPTGLPLVEFNHVGAKCWQTFTPELQVGDEVRVVNSSIPGNGYKTTLREITAGQPFESGAGQVQVKGTAATADGLPVPVGEVSMFIRQDPLRLLAPGDGTLAFDVDGAKEWTATFSGVNVPQVLAAGRLEATWSNLAATEVHVFDVLGVPGPADPACPPLGAAPGRPDLIPESDSGRSSTDNITSAGLPVLQGTAALPGAGADPDLALGLFEMVGGTPVQIGAGAAAADGGYFLTPTSPLPDGRHELRVSQVVQAQPTLSGPLSVTIDTQISPPAFIGSTPPSGGNQNNPRLRGTAEAGSTVRVFATPSCSGPVSATGLAGAFVTLGLLVAVPDNSTTTFGATAEDIAGNASGCSGPLTYAEVSPVAPATQTALGPTSTSLRSPLSLVTRRVQVSGAWRAKIRLSCRAARTAICVGRLDLLAPGTGKRKVIGTKTFAIRGGRQSTITVRLNALGRRLLAKKGTLRVGTRVTVNNGSQVARAAAGPLTLVKPTDT